MKAERKGKKGGGGNRKKDNFNFSIALGEIVNVYRELVQKRIKELVLAY